MRKGNHIFRVQASVVTGQVLLTMYAYLLLLRCKILDFEIIFVGCSILNFCHGLPNGTRAYPLQKR